MYKVTKQYGRGAEINMGGRFNNLVEAKAFVDKHIMEDALMNVKVIYKIYEFDELLSEYDSSKVNTAAARTSDEQGSQGKGSTASFRPTPLNTSPRPPGTPPKWIHDADEDKEDKEKK